MDFIGQRTRQQRLNDTVLGGRKLAGKIRAPAGLVRTSVAPSVNKISPLCCKMACPRCQGVSPGFSRTRESAVSPNPWRASTSISSGSRGWPSGCELSKRILPHVGPSPAAFSPAAVPRFRIKESASDEPCWRWAPIDADCQSVADNGLNNFCPIARPKMPNTRWLQVNGTSESVA